MRESALTGSGVLVLGLMVGVGLTGCGLFTEPGHGVATVEIEADRPTAIGLITSHDFGVTIAPDGRHTFDLRQADTLRIRLPVVRDFDLRDRPSFYLRVADADDPEAVVDMVVRVDGQQRFRHETTVAGDGIQFYIQRY
jgi:hypothetical protein